MKINGIDKIDNKILDLLLEDGRISYSEIGEILKLSRTTIKNRISFLEDQKLIVGYKAIINPLNMKNAIPYIVNIETTAELFEDIKNKLYSYDNVITIMHTTGKCKLILICVSQSVNDMSRFLEMVKVNMKGVIFTEYNTIVDVVKGGIQLQ